MTGAGLCGDPGMRDAEGAVFQDSGTQEGRKGPGSQVVFGFGVGFGERLKSFVGAQAITYMYIVREGEETLSVSAHIKILFLGHSHGDTDKDME